MNKFSEKRAFREEEAAIYTGMSRSFLRQARMTGPLQNRMLAPPFIKVGSRSIRYLREDLDSWLEQFSRQMNTHEGNVGKDVQNGDAHD